MFLPNQACFDSTALYWLSVSSGVKITQQGFLFLNAPVIHGGQTFACPRAMGALCRTDNYTFLPCGPEPRTRLLDAPPPFDAFWRNEAPCGKLPTLYDLDITPCDLQHGAAIVWADGLVSVQQDLELGYWANAAIMVLMVWLIVNFGETVALILEASADSHHHSTVALCVLLLAIVLASTPQAIWATRYDLAVYWSTVAYVVLYALYHLRNPNTINVIVGCMILVSARWYQTHENPYTVTFLFLIITRWVQKAHFVVWGKAALDGALWELARRAFMVLDAAFAGLLFACAYVPSFLQPVQAYLYLLGIVYASYCLGSFVAHYVRGKDAAKS
jgi:hypothetical protein